MDIAIIGANGLVGSKAAEILADKLPQHRLLLYGSTSVGQRVYLGGKTYKIAPTDQIFADRPRYALCMANEEVAKRYLPPLSEFCVCVDNSSAFRLQQGVPLVVPQINGSTVGFAKIIANPNCTTIQVAMALAPLLDLEPQKVCVVTYQAVSGAGRDGLCDLQEKRTYGKLKCFFHPIFDNVIAQIGEVLPDGSTTEEQKLRKETRKILDLPNLAVNSFCARVPITVGHCAFVNVQFAREFSVEEVRRRLKGEKDVLLFDDTENNVFPMPQVLRHTHFVGVGRISKEETGGLNMFVVADNLLRGAAYNAYQILQLAIKNNGERQC